MSAAPSPAEIAELAALVTAVPGVSTLYRPRLAAATSPRIAVTEASVTVRVGIDHTRTIAAVAHDIHRALAERLAGTPLHLEIATLR